MKKKITVYSLSKELGVSPATISKALNNSPELNADTIAMVRQKAEEYGFRPRQMASRTINICALIPTADPQASCFGIFVAEVMDGMMDYLLGEDLEFSLYTDTYERLNNGLLLRQLARRNINGAVLINPPREGALYEEFKKNRFPYVNLFSGPINPPENALTVDNVEVGFRAIDYLLQIGHREVAVIVTPPGGITGEDRLKGYKKALQKAGVTIDPGLIWYAEKKVYGLKAGYNGVMALHSSGKKFTALFVMSDNVAIGASRALCELGLDVPAQVSLLACGDSILVPYLNPPLTVMDIPNRKFGHAAAKRVHKMIIEDSGPPPVHESWMRGELIIRDSTAPPSMG